MEVVVEALKREKPIFQCYVGDFPLPSITVLFTRRFRTVLAVRHSESITYNPRRAGTSTSTMSEMTGIVGTQGGVQGEMI